MPELQRLTASPKGSGRLFAVGALLAAVLVLSVSQASAQTPSANAAHAEHDGMDMSMPMPEQTQSDPAQQAIQLKNKRESEFNHHLAGLFLILAGLFLLAENALRLRWPQARFAWPTCFLLAGLFLLVFSDTELWPFGPQSWWYGLIHDREDLQHKTFAAILLILGVLEIQRIRGVLKSAWAAWAFPALALLGSVLLLFHEHHTGMRGDDHMTVMARIQAEHLNFAIAGCGIGVTKGLSELRTRWQTVFTKSWPVLLIVLGILLLRYTE
jgi:putative copper resistance protein D